MKSTLAHDLLPSRPSWSKGSDPLPSQIPPCWRSWLLSRGSLTTQLKALPYSFHVDVLKEGDALAMQRERQLIPANVSESGWVREVSLMLDHKAAVFARTFIPHSSLSGSLCHVKYLGDRPLGHYLFSQPSLVRGKLHVARSKASNAHDLLWARTSVLMIQQKPLIITEGFTHYFQRIALATA